MSDTSKKVTLPSDLSEAMAKVSQAQTPLDTFRALKEAHRIGVLAHRKVSKKATEAGNALRAVETDMTFINRHKAKEDDALRVMRSTYSRPTKALAQFGEMCSTYAPDYVFEVLKLGATRIGSPLGISFLNYRSNERMVAEENYMNAVFPALAVLIVDQREYLRLRDTGIEAAYDAALTVHTEVNDYRLALEGVIREQERDMTAAAISLSEEEVKKLENDEAGFREMVLPERLKKAEAAKEAEKEKARAS